MGGKVNDRGYNAFHFRKCSHINFMNVFKLNFSKFRHPFVTKAIKLPVNKLVKEETIQKKLYIFPQESRYI